MSKKSAIITTACLLIALIGAAVGATLAWYISRAGADSGFILNANGYLVVYFDEEVNTHDAVLKPAVATKYAITNNETEFNVLDANSANIQEAATTAEFTTTISYINASNEDGTVPASDITFDCEVFAVQGENEPVKLTIGEDIAVNATVSGSYIKLNEEFTERTLNRNIPFRVNGDIDLSINITAYFLKPDDLCSPSIINADNIRFKLTIRADALE